MPIVPFPNIAFFSDSLPGDRAGPSLSCSPLRSGELLCDERVERTFQSGIVAGRVEARNYDGPSRALENAWNPRVHPLPTRANSERFNRFLARQPILTHERHLSAYEILSRYGPENYCRPKPGSAVSE